MGIFDRVLRAGEGKKLRPFKRWCPTSTRSSPRCEALDDAALQAKTGEFRQRLDNGEDLDDLLVEAFAVVREAADRVIGQRHYDVQLMGGAALHLGLGRRDEDRRGQDPRLDPARLPQRVCRQGRARRHRQRLPGRRDAEWMGQIHRWLGPDRRPDHSRQQRRATTSGRSTLPTSPTAPTTSSASTTSATTWRISTSRQVQRGHTYCHRRRGRLDPHRRGPHPADHQRPGRRRGRALLPVRRRSSAASSATSTTTSTRRSASSSPTEEGIDAVEGALGIENLYDGVSQNLVHQLQRRAAGQGAVPPRQGLPRHRRRGEDRRRVHRPRARRSALVRWPAPGGRGQRGRARSRKRTRRSPRSPCRTTSACTTSSPA